MVSSIFSDSKIAAASPTELINAKEFVQGMHKAGSLFSMLENKKINSTFMFVLLLENKEYQDFFTEVTASASFKDALLSLLFFYPTLVKSKFTKSALKQRTNVKPTNGTRKTSIQ
jgi:hypothetical protein